MGIEFPGAVYHVISRGNEKGCTWSSCPGYLRAGRQRDWVCYERVLGEFGREGGWAGRRSDDAARAVAAYLARRRFGHSAAATARALGYRDPSGVGRAVRRVERGTHELQKTVQTLARRLANP